MGRKKKLEPSEDGYIRTGIYQRYVGPNMPVDSEAALEQMRQRWEGLYYSGAATFERIREWLANIVEPFLLGPVESPKLRPNIAFHRLDLDGNGLKTYQGNCSLDDAARDAIKTLGHVFVAVRHLRADGDIDMLVNASLEIGSLVERIQVRAFEHFAMVGKGYVNRANLMRPKKTPPENLRVAAEDALAQAKKDFPGKGKTYQTRRAAESLEISLSAIYGRLKM